MKRQIDWRDPEVAAKAFAGNWARSDWSMFDFWWHREREVDDPHDWGIYLGYTESDNDFYGVSNTEAMWKELSKFGGKWAVWEDHNINGIFAGGFAIKVHTKAGKLSKAFLKFCEFREYLLHSYPVLDEDDALEREIQYSIEQLLEMFKFESPIRHFDLPEDKESFLHDVLRGIGDMAEDQLRRRDGGWPTDAVVGYLEEIGWVYDDDEMEWTKTEEHADFNEWRKYQEVMEL